MSTAPEEGLDLSSYFVEARPAAELDPGSTAFDPRLSADLFVGPPLEVARTTSEAGIELRGAGTELRGVGTGGRRGVDPDEPEPGAVIDKYRLEQRVGSGGFAVVYRATHLLLRVTVALKLLRPKALRRYPDLAEALCEEARLAARVTHPNVVRVLDVTHTPELTYLVIEFVEGGSLAELLRARRMTPAETVRLGIDVAEGLKAALARGLIHRDIKPGNILLTATGMAKVADLGLARMDHSGALGPIFDAKGLIGTPGYMAPEQALDPSAADCRADMYSLGVTLFHAAVGEPPFPLSDRARVLELHRTAVPQRPSSLVRGFSAGLERVILRLMAKSPSGRYESYDALLGDLRAVRL